jgi:hypothetical protein
MSLKPHIKPNTWFKYLRPTIEESGICGNFATDGRSTITSLIPKPYEC